MPDLLVNQGHNFLAQQQQMLANYLAVLQSQQQLQQQQKSEVLSSPFIPITSPLSSNSDLKSPTNTSAATACNANEGSLPLSLAPQAENQQTSASKSSHQSSIQVHNAHKAKNCLLNEHFGFWLKTF